jgi:cation diffusion facilitator family transporter
MIDERCIECGKKVEWIVLSINAGLFIIKGAFAIISHSRSLLADTFESLANLIITVIVLISLKIAERKTDKRFPYGYGKVEFLASGIVNMLLMFASIVFIFISFKEMIMVGAEKPPRLIAVVAAVLSIMANQVAFGYGRCAGEKLESPAILTNAWANRADVATSLAVIVAVGGTNLGFSKLDHIVAILIAFLIIKVTIDGIKKAIKGLMDFSLYTEEIKIRNLITSIEGVSHIGNIKARPVGRKIWIDMEISIPGEWVLSKGLETVQKIRNILLRKMENISEVSVQLIPQKR